MPDGAFKYMTSRSKSVNQEIQSHHPIEFPQRSSFYLLLQKILCCGSAPARDSCPNIHRVNSVLSKGRDKFDEDMDIISIIKKIRKHNVALKSTVLCCDEKEMLAEHARENVLEVDTSSNITKEEEPTEEEEGMCLHDNHASHLSCRKCEDFANRNIEAFVLSRQHACSKLTPDVSVQSCNDEPPKAQPVYPSNVSAAEIDYAHQSSAKSPVRSEPRKRPRSIDISASSDSFMKHGVNGSYHSQDSQTQRATFYQYSILQRPLALKKMCFYELKGNWAIS